MLRWVGPIGVLAAVLLAGVAGTPAAASECLAFVRQAPELVPAGLAPVRAQRADAAGSDSDSARVAITFVGHATFRIRSPGGVAIATDYAGNAGPGPVPDVVTMNRAHGTHYTTAPDPAIDHVLRGWNPHGGPARHDLSVGDVRIRNVPTDIRDWSGAVDEHGNSIFIFETADLCIGHLGHLHHELSRADLASIGRLDIVMAPVDGRYTMKVSSMVEVLADLQANLILPMHFFGGAALGPFLAALDERFEVRVAERSPIRVSLDTLPRRPTVLIPHGYGDAVPQ